jgi:hypothetical protein
MLIFGEAESLLLQLSLTLGSLYARDLIRRESMKLSNTEHSSYESLSLQMTSVEVDTHGKIITEKEYY